MTDFVHLHCHSEYSLLDGMSTPEDIARVASSNGQFAAAITDHGTMGGVLKFQDSCDHYGVRPLFGIEAYFVPSVVNDSDSKAERFHLILLAKNNEGLQKLFKANQVGWQDNFYYKPRMDFALLDDLVDDDIVALSGCMGGPISKAIERGDYGEAERLSSRFIDIFGDDFYYEIQAWNPPSLNQHLIDLAAAYDKKVVATADCHFPTAHDAPDEEVLLMISQFPSLNAGEKRLAYEKRDCGGSVIDKMNTMYPERFLRFDRINPYIADAETVMGWFNDVHISNESYLENTMEVADKCAARLERKKNLLPKYSQSLNSDDYLRGLCESALYDLARQDDRYAAPEYQERLDSELGIIAGLGFSDYFLIVWDMVNWARNNDVGIGPGRGSVGGSIIAFLLGITKVDPIKYNLLFARFINPERNDYPDIDLDFEDKKREKVRQYLIDRWGEDRVAAIVTYGTFKPKSAIKDVARVFQVPFDETNAVTPFFETLDELTKVDVGKAFVTKYPDILPISKKLEGRVRLSGIHPAGMVVANVPLTEVCPVETRKSRETDERQVVTALNMDDAEKVGLIKIDVLGLKAVAIVEDCIKAINERHGVDVTDESLGLDDQKVFEEFNNGSTVGVFQADAAAYRPLIEKMGIDNFNDLVVSNALVRPGALLSQGRTYIDCKKGKAKPKFPHESVKDILEETYGSVVYQEQLMQMAVRLADFTWAEADQLRKIIGKKRDVAEFDKFKEKFVNNKYLTKAQSEKMWSEFELASLYMFNKSHAVAYSMLSYQTMWLKVHYPQEFVWSLLHNESKQGTITAYLMEAERLGIDVLGPDVNKSGHHFTLDGDKIRFGLSNVKGCGKTAIAEIIENRPYGSYDEFVNKCQARRVNKTTRENLEKVGAFEDIGHVSEYDYERYFLPILGFVRSHAGAMSELDEHVEELDGFHVTNSPPRFVKAVVRSVKKAPKYLRVELEDSSGSTSVFTDRNEPIAQSDFIYALVGDRTLHMYTDVYEYVDSELHQLTQLIEEPNHEYAWLREHGATTSAESEVVLMYIFSVRVFTTSKGKDMACIYGWDGERFVKVVIFPKLYTAIRNQLRGRGWHVAKLVEMDNRTNNARLDSYKLKNAFSLITAEEYISKKGLKKYAEVK